MYIYLFLEVFQGPELRTGKVPLQHGIGKSMIAEVRIEHVAPRQSNLPHWKVQVTTWQKVRLQLFGQCHLVENCKPCASMNHVSLEMFSNF